MARMARVVAVGYPHHIAQRGNHGQTIFIEAIDYSNYLKLVSIYKKRYKVSILAYCIMPNHVHLVAIPSEKNSMSTAFHACNMCYAQYFNKKNDLKGHLWQGRFFSCILDEQHLYNAIKYVENNPVRGGLVERAEDWEWSSAKTHLNNEKSLLELENIDHFFEISNWKLYLLDKEDEDFIEKIRSSTKSGRPLGTETFIKKLEVSLNRSFKKPIIGRPKMTASRKK